MRSCDTCPGNTDCAAENLHPILLRVQALHAGGAADKFEILFALDDADEDLLDRFNHQISRSCWSKAALLAIADMIGRLDGGGSDWEPLVRGALADALAAFADFPWRVADLVEQAADLYEAVLFRLPANEIGEDFAEAFSKRRFVKLCKDVAYA